MELRDRYGHDHEAANQNEANRLHRERDYERGGGRQRHREAAHGDPRGKGKLGVVSGGEEDAAKAEGECDHGHGAPTAVSTASRRRHVLERSKQRGLEGLMIAAADLEQAPRRLPRRRRT